MNDETKYFGVKTKIIENSDIAKFIMNFTNLLSAIYDMKGMNSIVNNFKDRFVDCNQVLH